MADYQAKHYPGEVRQIYEPPNYTSGFWWNQHTDEIKERLSRMESDIHRQAQRIIDLENRSHYLYKRLRKMQYEKRRSTTPHTNTRIHNGPHK